MLERRYPHCGSLRVVFIYRLWLAEWRMLGLATGTSPMSSDDISFAIIYDVARLSRLIVPQDNSSFSISLPGGNLHESLGLSYLPRSRSAKPRPRTFHPIGSSTRPVWSPTVPSDQPQHPLFFIIHILHLEMVVLILATYLCQ